MSLSETYLDHLATAVASGTSWERMTYFRPLTRLLAHGDPVSTEQLARVLGRPEAEVSEVLRQFEEIVFDERGRVVGAGLSLLPTPYRIEVQGHELFTWCALDTLIFPAWLGYPAQVSSTCPATGTGHFQPGARLIERELCTLLGVSRTSLREALRQLEGDGLVTNIPHKGMVVTTMTRTEAQEIYEVRAVVEGLAGRLCAERLTSDLAAALTTAMQQIEAAHQAKDLAGLIAAKEQFYLVLLAGCGNRTAGVVLQSLHDRIASLRALTLAQPGRAEASVAEMRRMLAAMLAADGPAACQACIAHVEQAAKTAAAVFQRREQHASSSSDQECVVPSGKVLEE